ncbi:hypothetical protein ABBQ38_010374 [Trebouxia sp. C0009 RCD-2024]
MSASERPARAQDQDARRSFSSPLSPVEAPLRSQVSSLMNTSPRKSGSGISPFTNPQGVGSLAPLVLPGLWRRASVPSGVSLQQQMSSLGQQYQPEDNAAQLMPYGSALNLPGQVEDSQSVSLPEDNAAQLIPYGSALNLPGQVEDSQSGKYFVYGTCCILLDLQRHHLTSLAGAKLESSRIRAVKSPIKPGSPHQPSAQQSTSPIAQGDRNPQSSEPSSSSISSEDSAAFAATKSTPSSARKIWINLLLAVVVLLLVAVHDILLVFAGCVLANRYYNLSPDVSHVALNQALRVYSNPTFGNPVHSTQRSQGFTAHVEIASQSDVMHAEDFDESLAFGSYASSDNSAFKPHASLTAQANGSLNIKAAGLQLLPGGGESRIGSGKLNVACPASQDTALMLSRWNRLLPCVC